MASDPPPNHMAEATREAVRRARERLAGLDLAEAAARLGLAWDAAEGAAGAVRVSLLGRALRVSAPGPGAAEAGAIAVTAEDGRPVHPWDEALVLRYLEFDGDPRATGELIAYRQLPGGNFYLDPVLNRTTRLLEKTFGNDTARLAAALARYPHRRVDLGDLGAEIAALGPLTVTLVYRAGDEEFPAGADLLYDRVIARIYHTDEVAALATRLCLGLIAPRP